LLTTSTGGELSSHPTVHEYFARHVRESGKSLVPIHRYLAAEYMRTATPLPQTFDEASPLLIACRHAAACQDWTLFDDLFRRRLMRGFRHYLCNNLGAWEEALDRARLADQSSFPADSTSEPGYYRFTVARCLKHLGRSTESRAMYLDSLKVAAASSDPDTAMYVNNFLTLLVWRGELAGADHLVELNIRALSWITEPWRHRWQIEHGFSSIAYLKMHQGSLDTATVLFDFAARAWDGYPDERPWIYDYYPYYRSELVLLADPTAHDDALAGIESLLAVAHAQGWPESICRGHTQAAVVHLDRASMLSDPAELVRATQRLDQAHRSAAGMNVADVAIAHHLTRLKAALVRRELYEDTPVDTLELESLIDRVEVLIRTSGLALATPEVIAARGALAYLEGSVEKARATHEEAMRECERQGNALTPGTPRSLVNWLGQRVGMPVRTSSTASKMDVIGLVGSTLSADWMTSRLDELATLR
jgi:tetratricopeptide (TPR) repeat protein